MSSASLSIPEAQGQGVGLRPKKREDIVLEAVTKEMTAGLGWEGPSKGSLQSGGSCMSEGGRLGAAQSMALCWDWSGCWLPE